MWLCTERRGTKVGGAGFETCNLSRVKQLCQALGHQGSCNQVFLVLYASKCSWQKLTLMCFSAEGLVFCCCWGWGFFFIAQALCSVSAEALFLLNHQAKRVNRAQQTRDTTTDLILVGLEALLLLLQKHCFISAEVLLQVQKHCVLSVQ